MEDREGTRRLRQRAAAVVVRDDKVLLIRDRGQRQFSLPGGGIKKRETVIGAAARELDEELRLEATTITRLPKYDYNGTANAHRVCVVEVWGEPILRRLAIEELLWWDMKEPVPLMPHVTAIVNGTKKLIKASRKKVP
jgi:8-oxo-dGTP pyrophosphatase MutT (NUDIX family)